MPFARPADRLSTFLLYSMLLILVAGAGTVVVNHSRRLSFYAHFLLKWESALTRFMAKDAVWPQFTGNNHVQYMDDLAARMKAQQVQVPTSNTGRPYIWHLPGDQGTGDLFVLCMEKKIILYGLPEKFFIALDKKIDGKSGPRQGRFTGKLQKDKEHYAGIWKI